MRSVRRGEAAYLELMREAKAQFDAEIAKNKEKGKRGRPRANAVPAAAVVEGDDDVDLSDIIVVIEEDTPVEEEAPVVVKPAAKAPAKSAPKAPAKSAQKALPKKSAAKPPTSAAKKVAHAKPAAKKPAPAPKKGAKKAAKRR